MQNLVYESWIFLKRKNFFTAICAGGLGIVLLFSSGALSDGIRRGLSLCSGAVIPSLFPFMALSVFICKSYAADFFSAALRPVTKFLKLPESAGGILLAAEIGGYPAAAKCINDSVLCGTLTQKTGARMLTFCVNPGPPFLIAAVGGAMLGSIVLGMIESFCDSVTAIAPYKDAIEFSILIIILLVKPTGLLGKKINEKV